MKTHKIVLLFMITILTFSCKSDDDQNQNQLFSPPDFILGTYISDGTGEVNKITFTENNIIIDYECCFWEFDFNLDFNSPELTIEEVINEAQTSYSFAINGPSSAFPLSQNDVFNLCFDFQEDCEFSLSFQLGTFSSADDIGIFVNGPGLGFFAAKQ